MYYLYWIYFKFNNLFISKSMKSYEICVFGLHALNNVLIVLVSRGVNLVLGTFHTTKDNIPALTLLGKNFENTKYQH